MAATPCRCADHAGRAPGEEPWRRGALPNLCAPAMAAACWALHVAPAGRWAGPAVAVSHSRWVHATFPCFATLPKELASFGPAPARFRCLIPALDAWHRASVRQLGVHPCAADDFLPGFSLPASAPRALCCAVLEHSLQPGRALAGVYQRHNNGPLNLAALHLLYAEGPGAVAGGPGAGRTPRLQLLTGPAPSQTPALEFAPRHASRCSAGAAVRQGGRRRRHHRPERARCPGASAPLLPAPRERFRG